MSKYLTEFIGTFFLVFVIGLAGIGGMAGTMAPLAIAAVLMALVYAGGHISGAHYNPAVTLAVWVRGKMNIADVITYWIAQIGGAILAWAVVKFVFEIEGGNISAAPQITKALVAELLGTFVLCYVILNVATAKANVGNGFYGAAIAITVLACALTLGGFSGGAFNPAVAIGVVLMKGFVWADIWIYLVGCFGGAFLAAIVFNMIVSEEK